MAETAIYLHLPAGGPIPDRLDFDAYKCVVVIEDELEWPWQHQVSRWLVDTGCLYVMAWGRECSTWDDTVDMANIEAFDYEEIPEAHFVLTTWHCDEPLDEVLGFARCSAEHPSMDLDITLILHIASKSAEKEMVKRYKDAWK